MAKFEFENWNMCNGRRARLLFSSCLFGRQLNMTVANEGKWATTTELKKKINGMLLLILQPMV